jgi:tetratricopeptide (TPR) repeat protein
MISACRILTAAALAVLLAGAGPALGAGSDSGNSLTKKRSSTADDYVEAQKLLQAGEYEDAIDLFEEVLEDEPGNADVLNYLGYSHRKLGETDEALDYYLAALRSQPEHVGANEYLGELYLEMGDVAKAEERLSVLQRACSSCMEEDELAEKIAASKAD